MRDTISAKSVKPALGHVRTYGRKRGGAPEQPPPQHEKGEDGRGRRKDVRWVRGWKGIRGHSERDKK